MLAENNHPPILQILSECYQGYSSLGDFTCTASISCKCQPARFCSGSCRRNVPGAAALLAHGPPDKTLVACCNSVLTFLTPTLSSCWGEIKAIYTVSSNAFAYYQERSQDRIFMQNNVERKQTLSRSSGKPPASSSTSSLEAGVSSSVSPTVTESEAAPLYRLACAGTRLDPAGLGWVGKTKWIKDSSRNWRQRGMWDSFRGLWRLI